MPLVTWLLLVGLSVLAVAQGQVRVALVLAGGKAILVGLEFMELRQAARLHAVLYVLFVLLVVAILILQT